MKKAILIILLLLVVVVGGLAGYTAFFLPDVESSEDIHIDVTPERVKRGEYLANHVTLCIDCHSTRDWSRYSGPLEKGTEGKGGEYFGPEMGFPGKIYSKNITPFHLKDWTDGELFRTITTGVSKDGKALFPVMPYHNYGQMDKEDIFDIIAYIRTLQPITYSPPKRSLDFPVNFILNTIPQKAGLVKKPPVTDRIAYGRYMINAAACIECHTPAEKGKIIPEKAFNGGRSFEMPNGIVTSANLTPDNETGIGNWTAETFVSLFKKYSDPSQAEKLKANDMNTVMPWTMYAGMDSTDLVSIFEYLKTLPPVKNKLVSFVAKSK